MLKGDVILQLGGREVSDTETLRSLAAELATDKSVPLLIKRENRSLFLALRADPEGGEN